MSPSNSSLNSGPANRVVDEAWRSPPATALLQPELCRAKFSHKIKPKLYFTFGFGLFTIFDTEKDKSKQVSDIPSRSALDLLLPVITGWTKQKTERERKAAIKPLPLSFEHEIVFISDLSPRSKRCSANFSKNVDQLLDSTKVGSPPPPPPLHAYRSSLIEVRWERERERRVGTKFDETAVFFAGSSVVFPVNCTPAYKHAGTGLRFAPD